jgi:hypothetical protein
LPFKCNLQRSTSECDGKYDGERLFRCKAGFGGARYKLLIHLPERCESGSLIAPGFNPCEHTGKPLVNAMT